jgi:uncharacterized membrane protein
MDMWQRSTVKWVVAAGATTFVVFGFWAFFFPYSFADIVATYPPFNRHLVHDDGAFQLGIAAALFSSLVWTDVLLVALFGGTIATTMHAVSHILDVDLGGRPIDPYLLSVLALAFIFALVLRSRAVLSGKDADHQTR